MLLCLLAILAIELAFLMLHPLVHIDSGWTAEVSNMLASEGRMAAPSWSGFLNQEDYFFWRPPLFFVFEAAIFKLLGFGLLQVGLLNAFIILATFAIVITEAKKLYGKPAAIVASAVLASNFMYLLHGVFHGRPDPLVGLLNLISMKYLLEYSSTRAKKAFLLSAFFASLSALTHELGLLMVATVAIVLVKENGMKDLLRTLLQLVKMAAIFIAVFIPYLLYASMQPAIFSEQVGWLLGRHGSIQNVIQDEVIRYYWAFTTNSGAMAPWFAFFMALMIFTAIRRDFSPIPLAIFMHLFLMFFIGNKATYYYIAIVPLAALLAGKIFSEISMDEMKSRIAIGAVLLTFLSSIALFGYFALKVSPQFDFFALNSALASEKYGMVVAQPAYYYAMQGRMYSAYAIFNRIDRGESLPSVISQLKPGAFYYDPLNLEASSPPEFKQYLLEETALVKIVCARNGRVYYDADCKDDKYRVEIYKPKQA